MLSEFFKKTTYDFDFKDWVIVVLGGILFAVLALSLMQL